MSSSVQNERVSHRMANEVVLVRGEDIAPPRLLMPTTVANLGAKLPAEQRRKLEATQESEQAAHEIVHQIHSLPRRTTHYIWHPDQSINNSVYVWHDDARHIAQFYTLTDKGINKTILTSLDNEKNRSITQLLDDFCQKVEHPVAVSELSFVLIGVFTGHLFRSYDGSKFRKDRKIWGVQGIAEVNRSKHMKVLHKRLQGNPVEIMNLGNDEIILHKDQGMLERGLVNYSIIGEGDDNDFAFVIIVNINDPEYTESYEFPAPAFDVVLAMGCLNFVRARVAVNNAAYQTEAARLLRQIGEGVFRQLTRPLDTMVKDEEESGAGEASTAPSPPHRQPKKKKAKKAKKAKKEVAVDEAERVEEGAAPPTVAAATSPTTTTIDPPAPSSPLPPLIPPTSVFSFADPSPLLTCAHPACNAPTHTVQGGAVVICPRCSPYSAIRYCTVSHLLDPPAVRQHHLSANPAERCGLTTLLQRAVDDSPSSIPDSSLPPRAYVHEDASHRTALFSKNVLERHRQALWRCVGDPVETDYYIFDDLEQMRTRLGVTDTQLAAASLEARKEWLNQVRGLGGVKARIAIDPAATARIFVDGKIRVVNLREKFNGVVDGCLRLGFAAGTLEGDDCMFIYTVVRGELQKMGVWDAGMCELLVVQMGFEFGWVCPEDERVGVERGVGVVWDRGMWERIGFTGTTDTTGETYI